MPAAKAGYAIGAAEGWTYQLAVQLYNLVQYITSFYYYWAGMTYGSFFGVLFGTKKYVSVLLVDLYRLILGGSQCHACQSDSAALQTIDNTRARHSRYACTAVLYVGLADA